MNLKTKQNETPVNNKQSSFIHLTDLQGICISFEE